MRKVYRDKRCIDALDKIISDLNALRKHDRTYFALGELVEMELAVERLNRALTDSRLRPHIIEEVGT